MDSIYFPYLGRLPQVVRQLYKYHKKGVDKDSQFNTQQL